MLFWPETCVSPFFLGVAIVAILYLGGGLKPGAPAGGEGTNPLNAFAGLFSAVVPGAFGDAGDARDIARFVVLLVGTMLLAGLMYFRWERESSDDAVKASDS